MVSLAIRAEVYSVMVELQILLCSGLKGDQVISLDRTNRASRQHRHRKESLWLLCGGPYDCLASSQIQEN